MLFGYPAFKECHREHARSVSHSDHLAARKAPVHKTRQSRDEVEVGDVRLLVEDCLVRCEADHRSGRLKPSVLVSSAAARFVLVLRQVRNGTTSAPSCGERQVAVHHRRESKAPMRVRGTPWVARRRPSGCPRRPRGRSRSRLRSRSTDAGRTGSPSHGCPWQRLGGPGR